MEIQPLRPSSDDSSRQVTTLPITVDKSHIITIGERLYTESIELIRELANNAYDADATRVDAEIRPDEIVIADDGVGMDLGGLRQYFSIGSEEKKRRPKSPKFHRDRIGQFGIGKFASLTACRRFEVETIKGDFHARVVFDREVWESSASNWAIPLEILSSEPVRKDGTTVKLTRLQRSFDPEEVRRRLMESVPLKAPHFEVFLNGQKVQPRYYAGHKIGIMEGTRFGPVFGEIVILPASQSSLEEGEEPGLEIKVKQVTVARHTPGFDQPPDLLIRMRGEIHADFLPVTSDRSGFVKDSAEYQSFLEVMDKIVREVKKVFLGLTNKKEKRRASRALNEALDRITQALNRNPELSPFGPTPSESKGRPQPGPTEQSSEGGEKQAGDALLEPPYDQPRKKHKKRKGIRRISPDAVVKRFRLGSSKIACCLDNLGADGPECQSGDGVIYVNRDHPLYARSSRSLHTYMWHIGRLLAQEICLMTNPSTPRQAFLRQSRIMKDAFSDIEETEGSEGEIKQ